jgi:hypothetical protein
VPNEPMVPTAPTPLAINPMRPLRRHIGQPFGSFGRRPNGQRVTPNGPSKSKGRSNFGGQRAMWDGPRATSDGC